MFTHMGERISVGRQGLSFFGHVGLSHSVGSGLMHALYLLSGFLSVPSFPTSALVTLDWPSLTIQSGHHFLRPFFLFVDECDIDDKLLVLESLWF